MKPILCLDWDGVIHSYTSGWQGANVVGDPPVPGAIAFIKAAQEYFTVAIHSSRSHQPGGIGAMQEALARWATEGMPEDRRMQAAGAFVSSIQWPMEKPPAFLTLDDRGWQFDGTWPDLQQLVAFRPWNKR